MGEGVHSVCPECGATYSDARLQFCAEDGAQLTPAGPQDDLSGRTIAGRYKIIEEIGRGGMGAVYRAEQLAMNREVALKVLRAELTRDPAVQARFAREARSASQVVSPNVVTLFDHGQTDDGILYIAMELLIGRTLAEHIALKKTIPWRDAALIARDIANALDAAHGAGVVHRDLKPDNVHLDKRTGSVKVLDFGIAKVLDDKTRHVSEPVTIAGSILGTPMYMSPEGAARNKKVGRPADIYALGVILFEMLAGRPLFDETEPVLLLGMHIKVEPERLLDARPDLDLPEPLDELVTSMLQKDPSKRPAALAVREQLEDLLGGRTSVVTIESGRPPADPSSAELSDTVLASPPKMETVTPYAQESGARPHRSARPLWAAAAVMLLGGVGGAGWYAVGTAATDGAEPPPPASASAPVGTDSIGLAPVESPTLPEPDAGVPPPSTAEHATIESATIEHATIESATIESATIESATIESAGRAEQAPATVATQTAAARRDRRPTAPAGARRTASERTAQPAEPQPPEPAVTARPNPTGALPGLREDW